MPTAESWPADKHDRAVPLREPRAAALPARRLRCHRGVSGRRWRNYELQQPRGSLPSGRWRCSSTSRRSGCRSQRVQGSGRALPGHHEGDPARAAGVRPQARAPSPQEARRADYEAKRRSIFELYIEEVALAIEQAHRPPRGRDQAGLHGDRPPSLRAPISRRSWRPPRRRPPPAPRRNKARTKTSSAVRFFLYFSTALQGFLDGYQEDGDAPRRPPLPPPSRRHLRRRRRRRRHRRRPPRRRRIATVNDRCS